MAYREYADLILRRRKLVERNVAGPAVGDHQLAQFPCKATPDQGMARKRVDRFADGCGRNGGDTRIRFGEKLESALEVFERPSRVDYLRHG